MQAKILIAAAVVAASATAPVHAADRDFSERIFAAMGDTIAAQGNEALRDIRRELRKGLTAAIKPLLPEPAESDTSNSNDSTPADARSVQ